jgi:phospholipid-binding lipoprotein MlaA
MNNSEPATRSTPTRLATLGMALALTACAGVGGHPRDPLEPLNRATFAFNETADKYVMRPVAQVYDYVPPCPSRSVSATFSATSVTSGSG